MRHPFVLFFSALALMPFAGRIDAQERFLHWDSLSVQTYVDADGRLLIRERHAMVFSGDWNGGERRFQLRDWQTLDLMGVVEIDRATQSPRPLSPGDLDQVGEYRLNGNTLRWRSRMPDDPPFDTTRRTYEIHYSISGALIRDGEKTYRLEHDLAFPNRDGVIENFDATLIFDPAWVAEGVPSEFRREQMQPGESMLVTASLRHVGSGTPSAVASRDQMPSTTEAMGLRYGVLSIAVAFVLVHLGALIARERARGRFQPTLPLEQIDEAWLDANVFNHPPELVGAAWDLDTSASEVAALLARLEQQGALRSEVQVKKVGWFERQTLRMELLWDRHRLVDHERQLIDALFFDGSRTTDTDRIRRHYSKSGFSPADKIKAGIERQLPGVFANRLAVPSWGHWLTGGLITAAIGTLILAAIKAPLMFPIGIGIGFALLFVFVVGLVFAYVYRTQVIGLAAKLARTLVCVALMLCLLAFAVLGGFVPLVPFAIVGVGLIALGLINVIFNVMRSRETPEALAFRRQLGAARLYFERELSREQPRLKDAWYPYLLAFGLGPHIDKWFKSFGSATNKMRGVSGSTVSGSSVGSTNIAGAGSSWTGGGGTFGGAGASGTWAAAVGSIAAGVAKPSSGSSSSGGGSSSSSGGGGGGGW